MGYGLVCSIVEEQAVEVDISSVSGKVGAGKLGDIGLSVCLSEGFWSGIALRLQGWCLTLFLLPFDVDKKDEDTDGQFLNLCREGV